MLGLVLLLPLLTGVMVWEYVNPVSMLHRGLIFGFGWAWILIAAVFLYDLLIVRRGFCGHLCPMGACYALIGAKAAVYVAAHQRERCDDCMDCFEICPEPQVIKPALKGADKGLGPVITSIDCTKCGRCIDVCSKDVFRFHAGRIDADGYPRRRTKDLVRSARTRSRISPQPRCSDRDRRHRFGDSNNPVAERTPTTQIQRTTMAEKTMRHPIATLLIGVAALLTTAGCLAEQVSSLRATPSPMHPIPL